MCTHDIGDGRMGFGLHSENERCAVAIHHMVCEHRGNDLVTERMRVHRRRVFLRNPSREVLQQVVVKCGIVGQSVGYERFGNRQLCVRNQHRQFGNGQPGPRSFSGHKPLDARERFECPIDAATLFEMFNVASVEVDHSWGFGEQVPEQSILIDVVGKHETSYLVGQRSQEVVASLFVENAFTDQRVEKDLEVYFVV